MKLEILHNDFTVCKIKDITQVDFEDAFVFVGKTDEELSLVCSTESVPPDCDEREDGWKGMRIQGTLDFSLVGILAKIADVLAARGISIFAVSTFCTDYILVKEAMLPAAVKALREKGYSVI